LENRVLAVLALVKNNVKEPTTNWQLIHEKWPSFEGFEIAGTGSSFDSAVFK
jgi:hypothetical protein